MDTIKHEGLQIVTNLTSSPMTEAIPAIITSIAPPPPPTDIPTPFVIKRETGGLSKPPSVATLNALTNALKPAQSTIPSVVVTSSISSSNSSAIPTQIVSASKLPATAAQCFPNPTLPAGTSTGPSALAALQQSLMTLVKTNPTITNSVATPLCEPNSASYYQNPMDFLEKKAVNSRRDDVLNENWSTKIAYAATLSNVKYIFNVHFLPKSRNQQNVYLLFLSKTFTKLSLIHKGYTAHNFLFRRNAI